MIKNGERVSNPLPRRVSKTVNVLANIKGERMEKRVCDQMKQCRNLDALD